MAATPWGQSQSKTTIARGIVFYSTASHGGYHISKKLNDLIPASVRNENGWYEEDCAWTIPIVFLKPHLKGDIYDNLYNQALAVFKSYYWQEYEKLFGKEVDPADSFTKRQHIFKLEYANDYQGLAAYGDWHKNVPNGFVCVLAAKGGRVNALDYPSEIRYFLVNVTEYKSRGENPFIIDLNRHQQIADFS